MQDKPDRQGLKFFLLKDRSKRAIFVRAFLVSVVIGVLGMVALAGVVSASPQTGAQGADWLRSVIGVKAVADLEAMVFTLQDKFHQLIFKVERVTPSAPWEVSLAQGSPTSMPNNNLQPPNTTSPGNPFPSQTSSAAKGGATSEPVSTQPVVSPTATQIPWLPARLHRLGNIPDEGIWTPYIQDATGGPLAYRTFLQPDPDRPYVTVAIVAFDLRRIRLHYVLGMIEPTSYANVTRTGQIPAEDQIAGYLLAAFNGGFKTVHGHYGVFMDGKQFIPPIDGIGTIAIYQNGSIRIGEWGVDLNYSPDMVVFRQNCPLMVHNGEINLLVYNNSVNDWGGTIKGNIVTIRSGIGISQDGKTLYYFAGNSLTMPALAKSMQDAGAYEAMQLDINNYYVHFTKFELEDNLLTAVPLLPKDMFDNVDRYLTGFAHDFFYITAIKP
jgi:hypothetical protein